MPVKNVPPIIGIDEPLKSWREASSSLRSNATGMALMLKLLEKADEAEALLATAQDRLNTLTSLADERQTMLEHLQQQYATLEADFQAKTAALEASIQAPLDVLRASVAQETAWLQAAVVAATDAHAQVLTRQAAEREAGEQALKKRQAEIDAALARKTEELQERTAQLREVNAALGVLRQKIGG